MSVLSRFLGRGSADEQFVIEPLRRRHITEILAIEQASYPKPWTRNVFSSEIELARGRERYYIVALVGAEVAGYAGLMFVVGDAHVTNIAVAPDRQRRGIATRLLAELTWVAIDRGCEAMTLEVRVSNVGAQALYRSFGFVPAGVRQRYYENTEDAIVMWCHDIGRPDFKERLAGLSPEAATKRKR
ncbi:MAG TPA: ribosomal protein S18-alanine N-acetyltransferase [Ilumatobacteraceae bacterium]|jgi:ribosomal-protein-alanine N-acetyltransferase|nr:ribosomal protein S18-alanine N-acetyltransferase [Ilumatobacteraceae bacterium]